MKRPLQGRYRKVATSGETFQAFVPAPLPPKPPIRWTAALRTRFDEALLALGGRPLEDRSTDHGCGQVVRTP